MRGMQREIEGVRPAAQRAQGVGAKDRSARRILLNDKQNDQPMQDDLRKTVASPGGVAWRGQVSRAVRNRSALPMTLTDESAIAAAARIGDSSNPVKG